jgi:hypothetical protein
VSNSKGKQQVDWRILSTGEIRESKWTAGPIVGSYDPQSSQIPKGFAYVTATLSHAHWISTTSYNYWCASVRQSLKTSFCPTLLNTVYPDKMAIANAIIWTSQQPFQLLLWCNTTSTGIKYNCVLRFFFTFFYPQKQFLCEFHTGSCW